MYRRVLAAAAEELDVDVPAAAEVARRARASPWIAGARFRDSTPWRRSATILSSPGCICQAVIVDACRAGRLRLAPRGRRRRRRRARSAASSVASSSATSSPVMCSFAASHVIASDGLLFDRPVGSRTRRLDAVDRRHALGDRVQPGEPRLPLGRVIALHPRLDRRQHAQRFLAPDLVVAARTVMRRAGLPRRLQDVLAAEQQPGALRSADRLAAAVGDDRRAALQVHVRNGQHFGRRIDEDRDVLRLGDLAPRPPATSVPSDGPLSAVR